MTRKGDWFITFSGVQFWPFDPHPDDIHIVDIAHALSRVCRYGGHCLDWYSVAQHSIMVSEIVPPRLALHALLHDAEEAYTGDMIRPIKHGLREATPAFDEMADRLTFTIRRAFALSTLTAAEEDAIKSADNHALSTERRDLVIATGREWRVTKSHPPLATKIVTMERDAAEAAFLARWRLLRREA